MGLLDGFVLLLVAHDGWVQSICRTVVWTNHLAWKWTEPLYTKETVGHSSTVSLRQGFSKFRPLGNTLCVCGWGGPKKKNSHTPCFASFTDPILRPVALRKEMLLLSDTKCSRYSQLPAFSHTTLLFVKSGSFLCSTSWITVMHVFPKDITLYCFSPI